MIPELIDIDIQQRAADINVPILRQPKFMALLKNYLSSALKLKTDIDNNIMGSLSYGAWSMSTLYNVGERVTAGRSSYECIQATTNTIQISDTNYWYKIASDTIGLKERLYYNCQRMQLEYVLNKRFNLPSLVDPPYDAASSKIYITTNPSYPNILWCARGNGNASGSFTAPNSSNRFYYCGREADILNDIHNANYIINAPNTLLGTIGESNNIPNIAEGGNIVYVEALKYSAVGLTFKVVGYP